MMQSVVLLLVTQGALGAFDTLFYHELRAHLPSRPTARKELALHGARSLIYCVLLGTLGWLVWAGLLTWLLAVLLLAEVGITLSDFVEEDRIRILPPGERITHAMMGIVYGAFVACLLPHLAEWRGAVTGFHATGKVTDHWVLALLAGGALASGARDLLAAIYKSDLPKPA